MKGRALRWVRKLMKYIAYAFCVVTAVLCVYPMLLTFSNSFLSAGELQMDYGMVFDSLNGASGSGSGNVNLKLIPDRATVSQYVKVFVWSTQYLRKFWNSVIYVVPIAVFQLLIALFAAYGFTRWSGKPAAMVFYVYVCLMLMPTQVTLVPNYIVCRMLGIINTRKAIWLPAFFSPFSVYLLTKYMKRIPHDIRDAAYVDGAGVFRTFLYIYVPMSKSIITACFMLVFLDYWNMVEQPLILLNDEALYPLSILLSRVGEQETEVAFALAVVYMVPGLLAFLYGEEDLVEGISCQGSIKG